MTNNTQQERVYNFVQVFYRKNGEKKSFLCTSQAEAARKRRDIKNQRRKFLGSRQLTLVEA